MGDSAAATWLPVGRLKPWDRNPRHDHDVAGIASSIDETGWGAPIVAQASSLRVIAGHGRLQAARWLMEHTWVQGEDGLAGRWEARRKGDLWRLADAPKPGHIPVRLVEVDDRAAKRQAIADNRYTELTEWDEDLLREMLREEYEDDPGGDWDRGLGFDDEFLEEPPDEQPAPRGGDSRGWISITVMCDPAEGDDAAMAIERALKALKIDFSLR